MQNTVSEITNRVCDKFKQIEEAETEHMAAGLIVDQLRAAMIVALEHQNETRKKLTMLRNAVIGGKR